MKTLIYCILFLIPVTVYSQPNMHSSADIHRSEIMEVIQTTNYSYLLAKEDETSIWLAVPKLNAAVGDIYYHSKGIEMRNFRSKELGRTFEVVFFLQSISSAESLKKTIEQKEMIKEMPTIGEIPEGVISVKEIFANMEKYQGQKVKLHGRVVKFNQNIMGKNWIHLQDGTGDPGSDDITITTPDITKVGSLITIEGTLITNKDYGSGYFYDCIIEEGHIIK